MTTRILEFAKSTPFCAGTVAQALRSLGSVLTDAADRIDPPPGPPSDAVRRVSPRPGPQSEFLASEADVAVMVGGPWTGKTFALLVDWLRHADTPGATGLIVCRRRMNITLRGGLWDEAKRIYAGTGVKCQTGPRMRMTWPSGATLSFGCTEANVHLRHEHDSWIGLHDAHEISGDEFAELARCARGPDGRPGRVRAVADTWTPWMAGAPISCVGRIRFDRFDTHACDVIPPDGMTRAQALVRLRMGDPSAFAGES